MTPKQFIEGKLKGCRKNSCAETCCDNDHVEEWVNEYFAFHERLKDYIASLGIKIKFIKDRVQFKNCSDGKECKFLKYSLNKDIDPRPIDCKIYPFCVDWKEIDFNKKIVHLHYWESNWQDCCTLVKKNAIPESFRKEVETIIKRDFAVLFYGARFKVKFIDKVYKDYQ